MRIGVNEIHRLDNWHHMAISIELVIGKWSFPFFVRVQPSAPGIQEKSDLVNSKNPDLPAYLNLSVLCFFSISDHFFLSSFPVHLCY
jgi:hypothetical protein